MGRKKTDAEIEAWWENQDAQWQTFENGATSRLAKAFGRVMRWWIDNNREHYRAKRARDAVAAQTPDPPTDSTGVEDQPS
jgi:hypothetical protein